tara:strand:+ start:466 stop:639 length:174 start_codon:yes stop_codon:yes gene_type:complete
MVAPLLTKVHMILGYYAITMPELLNPEYRQCSEREQKKKMQDNSKRQEHKRGAVEEM